MSAWLCCTYKVILILKFNAKAMSARKGRKVHAELCEGSCVGYITNLYNAW